MSSALNVLIASPLPDNLVDAVRAVDSRRLNVVAPRDLYPDTWDAAWPGWVSGSPLWSADQHSRWRELLESAEILYDTNWLPSPQRLHLQAPQLRWIQATISGVGPWAVASGMDGRHPLVTTAAGIHAGPLNEFVLHALLHFRRQVATRLTDRADRVWRRDATPELAGATVLIVGLGHVGRRVAKTLAALGVRVWAVRRLARPARFVERVVTRGQLLDVLPSVDGVVVSAPLTADTRGMIGGQELAAMPEGAIVINVGRGSLLDEGELVAALRAGRIAGAALDVFEREPLPETSPLWELPNVLISPHNAGVSRDEPERALELFLANLERYLSGRPLKNRYRLSRGY